MLEQRKCVFHSSDLAQSMYPTNHIRLRASGQRPVHKENPCSGDLHAEQEVGLQSRVSRKTKFLMDCRYYHTLASASTAQANK